MGGASHLRLVSPPSSAQNEVSSAEISASSIVSPAEDTLEEFKAYSSKSAVSAWIDSLQRSTITLIGEPNQFKQFLSDETPLGSKSTQKLNKAQNHKTMSEISREELDAKLQVIEARMDTRVAEVVGRIDAMIASQQGLVEAMRAGQEGLDKLYQAKFDSIDESQKATEAGIRNLKSTFIVTAISSAIAIVLGIAAFNATVLSNMVASFESGKNTMQSINQVSNQLNDTAKRLDELDKRIGKSGKSN